MRPQYFLGIAAITLAACDPATETEPPRTRPQALEAEGARNDAFRLAEARFKIPREVLMGVAYLQGRLEAPGVDEMQSQASTSTDPQEQDPHFTPHRFGIMYLSDEQVAAGAQLISATDDAVRTDVQANVLAAAALIAARTDTTRTLDWETLDSLEAALTHLRELEESPAAARLAQTELTRVLHQGFDLTTTDGERVAVRGFGELELDAASQSLGVGEYPAMQWVASPNYSSRDGNPIRYVVIHDMEGFMSGAISAFQSPARQSSAHYLLRSSDGHIVQMVTEGNNAWHCGNGWYNRNSIGIEHEGFAGRPNGGGYYTETQYRASAQLVAAIVHRYGIPVDRGHIFGHGNVPSSGSGGICSDAQANAAQCGGSAHHWDPGPTWAWAHYLDLIAQALNQPPPAPPTPPSCGGLASGAQLAPGQSLSSCSGNVTLVHQGDGNVVLYDNGAHKALWATGTDGRGTTTFAMQTDGNLVLYGNGALWNSGTYGNGGAILVVQDDGNLVVYGGGYRPLWNTGTHAAPPPPPPPPPPAQHPCGRLDAGASLARGEQVTSCSGRFVLAHQGDGNVVLYDRGVALWHTRTNGKATTRFVMQGDGNLVLYNGGTALWNSRTNGHGGAFLGVQDDGNVVIYQGATPLWATDTVR
ncbi:MAG: N-acetylmuramoyl-L-alanine amidase [Archangiaceae bacterium]|nr:N-acetylmuramoyl-L-alanine amidase [Archangiaceae bacterium]